MIGNSLHSAAEAGDVAKIEPLLAFGFSIDRRNDAGLTPLMMAAKNGKLQVVKCLLKQGADPSLQDNNGLNALHYASLGGNLEIIKLMLSHVPRLSLVTQSSREELFTFGKGNMCVSYFHTMFKGKFSIAIALR